MMLKRTSSKGILNRGKATTIASRMMRAIAATLNQIMPSVNENELRTVDLSDGEELLLNMAVSFRKLNLARLRWLVGGRYSGKAFGEDVTSDELRLS